jgi:ABC-2 type transport system permease protein
MKLMKKYLKYFLTNFHEEATYKADFIFFVGTEVIFFVVFYFIWTNVYLKGGISEISNFSLSSTITYYFLAGLLFRMNPGLGIYLNRAIWNGELTNEISKPFSVKLVYLVSALSLMAVQLIAYLPFAALILLFVSKYIIFVSFSNLLYFILAMAMSSLLGITFYLFLHSLCFHFGDQDANLSLMDYLIAFVGGALFPLSFLPPRLYEFFSYLPFKYLFDFPANIYLGNISGRGMWMGFAEMIIWTAIFFCVYYLSFHAGLKKYAAIGR